MIAGIMVGWIQTAAIHKKTSITYNNNRIVTIFWINLKQLSSVGGGGTKLANKTPSTIKLLVVKK